MVNPRAVERSVWNPNGTDKVVTFCVEAADAALTKEDVDALRLLEYVKLTQENWIEAGRNAARCARPFLRHNVSNTINVKADEWEDVTKYIFENRYAFTGIALLSHEGDLDYPQAPFCAIKDSDELLATYGEGVFLASGLIVDGIHAFGDNLWAACDAVRQLTPLEVPVGVPDGVRDAYEAAHAQKVDWVRRFKQFAERYLSNDLRLCAHCLKDVHNFKLWHDLKREYTTVDYSGLTVASDRAITADSACAGGKCNIL
jgi:ribonucleoside-diphosphate reductase alpha chain